MEQANKRQLPHNLDAERAVLGCMLSSPAALVRGADMLTAEDFYSAAHREIFEAMTRLMENSSNVDLLMVCEELERVHMLDAVGSVEYVSDLPRSVPSTVNLDTYIAIVETKSMLRALAQTGNIIATKALEASDDAQEIVEDAEKRIFEVSMRRQSDRLRHIKDLVLETYTKMGDSARFKGGLSGVPTGFYLLDRMTFGLQPSDLVIVAGRPSMGKTSFAMNIAQFAATNQRSVVVFSLEMSREQLVRRLLCAQAGVDMDKVRTGTIDEDEYMRLAQAMTQLADSQMYIDDTSGISVAEMRSKCRKLKLEKGLDLVLIDYLQLMSGPQHVENRQQEIAVITRSIKGMARELDVPVILLSQLSRAPESRADKRPMLADLRESGAIEQDADVVVLLYRKAFYEEDADNIAEAIVAKHRNGKTGTIRLAWQGEHTRFVNLDESHGG
ncbi:MAG: replicative DNA helicase [Bacillota bacterium]